MENQNKNKINNPFSCVILAAGKGTRMKSALPKVMHCLAGTPLISHVLSTLTPLSPEKTVVVVALGMDSVKQAASKVDSKVKFAVQKEQQGTGHADQVISE